MCNIFDALKDNNLNLLDELLQKGQNVDAVGSRGQTLLHRASFDCKTAAVKLILKHKPNVNLKDKDGQTPLLFSCSKGDLDSVVSLLERKANVNIGDNNNHTPLFEATRNNHLEVVKVLLSHGADPNIVTSAYHFSPLHKAQYRETVKVLVDFGAKIDATIKNNDTALTWASCWGHVSAVQCLCEMGANINHRGDHGRTALHQAINDDHTASYEVAISNRIPTIKYLLTQRPDISIMDDDELTVLQAAKKNGNKQIVDLIVTYIHKINIKGKCFIFCS